MRFSYKRALGQLTEYAMGEGYAKVTTTHEGGETYIEWEDNTLNEPKSIYIEGKYTLEIKTYLMLHELGHHELRKDWDKFKVKMPTIAYAQHMDLKKNERKYKRRNSYMVACLEEEFLAWDEGLRLGLRLGIKVNMVRWIEFKSGCLKRYIDYYGNLKK